MSGIGVFTIGEFMQKSGVSIRTLRYYDSINLLKPSDYTEGGHRLYSEDDLSTLQKIKSLKFLGLSLKDIHNVLQRNSVNGADVLKSLNEQKQLFEAKGLEIKAILSDLNHLIETIEAEEIININIFCTMVQKLMYEEDTQKWFEEHFSKAITDDLLTISKREEIDLDKKWTKALSEIKHLSLTGAIPSAQESQEAIESLLLLMNETSKGKLELIAEKLPSAKPLSFPNPFTEKEQAFVKEAMDVFRKKYKLQPY